MMRQGTRGLLPGAGEDYSSGDESAAANWNCIECMATPLAALFEIEQLRAVSGHSARRDFSFGHRKAVYFQRLSARLQWQGKCKYMA
jgi:hypothetical protein